MAMSKLPKDQLKFVDSPADEFNCPICLGILQEPYLTACCGNHFCEACIEKVKKGLNKCPLCQEKPLNGIINKNLRRKLNEVKLYCIHTEAGCKWKGDLGKLEQHLAIGEIRGECQFVMVKCTVSELCNVMLARKSITDHASNVCQYRQFRCEHCNYQSTYLVITTEHYNKCPTYPMLCPNNCSKQTYPRDQLDTHLASCPEQEVNCTFCEMGCKEKLKRRQLQQHLDTNLLQHQMIMCQAYHSLQQDKRKLEEQVASLTQDMVTMVIKKIDWPLYLHKMSQITPVNPVAPIILEIPFRVSKASSVDSTFFLSFAPTYYSPSFYSHPNGYKLRLSTRFVCQNTVFMASYLQAYLHASGRLADRVNDMVYGVQVSLCTMDGAYDDHLKWPFEEKINIRLLNKQSDDHHYKIDEHFKGNKVSQLILANASFKPKDVINREYEHLLKLKETKPTEIVNKLWNMFGSIQKPRDSLLFHLDNPLKVNDNSIIYFEISFNVD